MTCPLAEDDFDSEGMVEPARVVPEVAMPERAVLCFFGDVVTEVVATRPEARQITTLTSEVGANPVWEIELDGTRIAVVQPGVGAPMAAAFCEEIIAMGVRRLIACGGAGALTPELVLGHDVVVTSAVRDEGTSYHYLPPAPVVEADPHAVTALVRALEATGAAHTLGRSWSTDAIYRETRSRVERRRAAGCLTVEMEAAALFAVARYRQVNFGQVLLAADSLAGESWDDRGWMSARDARQRLFWIATHAAASL
jgi:uridine phosphorylase